MLCSTGFYKPQLDWWGVSIRLMVRSSQLKPLIAQGPWHPCSGLAGLTTEQLCLLPRPPKELRAVSIPVLSKQAAGDSHSPSFCPTSFSTAWPYFCNDRQKRKVVEMNVTSISFPTWRNSCAHHSQARSWSHKLSAFIFLVHTQLNASMEALMWTTEVSCIFFITNTLSSTVLQRMHFIDLYLGNDCQLTL